MLYDFHNDLKSHLSPFNSGSSSLHHCAVLNVTQEFTWKHLMDELSRGVVLRPPRDRLNTGVPLPVKTSPFSQLLQDIQLRRYTLRKVKVTLQHFSVLLLVRSIQSSETAEHEGIFLNLEMRKIY